MHTITRLNFASKHYWIRLSCYFGLILFLLAFNCPASLAEEPGIKLSQNIIGDYQLQGVMETASGLRLSADGTYKFFLSYGSVDEADSGKWHVEGAYVVLNSTIANNEPEFVFVRSSKEEFSGVRVSFEGKGSDAAAFYTQVILQSNDRQFTANEGYKDYKQSSSANTPVNKISLYLIGALRQYRVFEFKPADPTHNHFVFRLNIGNFGHVRFEGARLRIGDGDLYLKMPVMRHEFRYVPVKGKSQLRN